MANLEEVGSSFYLYGTQQMETLELDSLTEVNGSMSVSYNTGLETFSAPILETLNGNLTIQENSDLFSVDLSSLECVDDYTIEGNDLSEDDKYDLLVLLSDC